MSDKFIYLKDEDFTKSVIADKLDRKLSSHTFKMFMQIATGLTYKSSYIGYNDLIKQDMISEAVFVFNSNWKTFSPFRREVKKFLDAYPIEEDIGRTYYNEFIKELIEEIELDLYGEETLKRLGVDQEGITIFNRMVASFKDVTEYKSGAYSFFTALCENAFKVVLNKHYEYENATRSLIDMCYNHVETFSEELLEDITERDGNAHRD